MSPSEKTIQGNDTTAFPFEEGLVIFRNGANRLFMLNATARLVWEHFLQGLSPDDIAVRLTEFYGIPLETAQRDVHATLDDWHAQGLLGEITSDPENPGPSPIPTEDSAESFSGGTDPNCPPRNGKRNYVFLGKPFSIRFGSADLEATVHPSYAHLTSSSEAPSSTPFELVSEGGHYLLLRDGLELVRTSSFDMARGLLFKEIFDTVHRATDWLACIHAAAAGDNDVCIVLPGTGGTGKSTLCAALMHAGFTCFSDDRAFLDGKTLRIATSPHAICLKEGGWTALRSRFPEIDTLPTHRYGGRSVRLLPPPTPERRLSPPVKCMVFPGYHPKRQTTLRPVSATEALARMMQATLRITPDAAKVNAFLDWLRATPCYDLYYPSLDEAVPALREILAK